MEEFIVSARKYRPKTFESVVGQENITNNLLKAIENNHLAQAFLFCGPRGVGKTSCARILARTVNEFHSDSNQPDQDFAFNIFELDAASNNSVEDIRNLIDQTRIPPQTGKYKVYIIDEVHMLSTNAFNAFLKTLEEPPPYAIFILATTEKHKVLPTILSRCQVYDFHAIQVADMVKHLQGIAQKEGIDAQSDALHIIAEKADGALRDALSIFDQIVGVTGKKLTYQDVIDNLNILDYDYYFAMTEAFLRGDKTEVLLTLNTIIDNGFDGHVFVNGLASHFRNLLFCTSEKTAAILQVGETIQKRYVAQAQNCQTRFILNAMHKLSEVDINYKSSKNKRLLVELTLLGLCALADQLHQKKNPDSDLTEADTPGRGGDTPQTTTLAPPEKPELPNHLASRNGNSRTERTVAAAEKITTGQTPSPAKHEEVSTKAEPQRGDIPDAAPVPAAETRSDNDTARNAPAGKESVTPPPPATSPELAEEAEKYPKPDSRHGKTRFSGKLKGARSRGLPSLTTMSANSGRTPTPDPGETLKEEDFSAPNENRPADDFNLAQLWKAWEEYTRKVKEEGNKSYYATLTKHQPIVRDKNKVEFLVDHHVQLSDLESDRTRLLEFLREKLNNWQIQLTGIIQEDDPEEETSMYDPRKRFEAMRNENPLLGKMQKIFDLDVEHDS